MPATNSGDERQSLVLFVFLTAATIAAMLPAGLAAQPGTGTLRVDVATGTDSGSCGGPTTPCDSIQQAVELATDFDTILVAEGTYTYNGSVFCENAISQSAVVCVLNKQLSILGGYSTGNWGSADHENNVTTIDGGNQRKAVLVQTTSAAAPPASLRIEGFTITRGRAQGGNNGDSTVTFAFGGGMDSADASVEVRDVLFTDNQSLAGDNTSGQFGSGFGGSGSGGALAIRDNPNTSLEVTGTLERVTFRNNLAEGGTGPNTGGLALGGALFIYESTVTGDTLVFENNTARAGDSSGCGQQNCNPDSGLRADALGGAVAFEALGSRTTPDFSVTTLTNVIATGNTALGGDANAKGGGGFGGAFFAERATVTLRDADVRNNEALGGAASAGGIGAGGGFMSTRATVTLDRVQLLLNDATGGAGPTTKGSGGGGGGYFSKPDGNTTVTITNSIIADNVATLGNGGGNTGGGGGGLFFLGSRGFVSHTTVARNRAPSMAQQGIGIVLVDFNGTGGANVDFDHSIIADHTDWDGGAAAHIQDDSTITFDTGLFAGNVRDTNFGGVPAAAGVIAGIGSMLSAGSAGFVSPGSPNYDYHLDVGSAAIDEAIGSNETTDIDGDTRIGTRDIGADELGNSLHSDDFELGNLSRWSSVV